MNATLKALIVWLMLLAVPLQGFASETQLWCAPLRAAAQHASFAHHLVASADDHRATTALANSGEHAAPHHHPEGKCGSCGSCCPGVSMAPSFMAALPAFATESVSIPFDRHALPSVVLALPERPPRL